jgi:hypothetical protein
MLHPSVLRAERGRLIMTERDPAAGQPPASPLAPPGIDATVAHPARMLNYVLGGTANFPVDRETAERRLEVLPGWRTSAQQNRRFHRRAIRLLAGQAGITQFLDPGVVLVCDWRPEPGQPRPAPHLITCYGAVGRKP